MSLKYNSYRKDRYYRSFFKDGRYYTANEARDIQLEDIAIMRKILENTFGDQFCVEDSLKPSIATQILSVSAIKYSMLPCSFLITTVYQCKSPDLFSAPTSKTLLILTINT